MKREDALEQKQEENEKLAKERKKEALKMLSGDDDGGGMVDPCSLQPGDEHLPERIR